MTAVGLFERGRLYDKMDRFDEAWADYVEANRLCREVQGRLYAERMAADLVERLKGFFTRSRMSLLPGAHRQEGQPIFVGGYPRSGTTMVEQTLTAHPLVSAGDELVFINDLTRVGPRWLGSPQPYPEALADLWMGDNLLVLDQFRDYYLDRAEQLGIWEKGAIRRSHAWATRRCDAPRARVQEVVKPPSGVVGVAPTSASRAEMPRSFGVCQGARRPAGALASSALPFRFSDMISLANFRYNTDQVFNW
jgi:hypothetical protein